MFKWLKSFACPKELAAAGVLGMNRRNFDVISKYNKRCLYPLVDDKVKTKELANKVGINTPGLIGKIEYQHEAKNILDIIKGRSEFVIKPAQGSGGKGVLVIKDYHDEIFVTASGRELSYNEVYQHISNILSGLYSLGGKYDTAIIEELVHFSNIFKDYSYQGVPDVRVIVYKGFPAMAMTRLPTKASGGRANLHQGAIGVGLDISTGKALHGVCRDVPISVQPDTGADLMKIEVPFWREHLIIGALAYEMTGLGYLGADIVLDANRGPMMLELNARPGLAIQIANGIGLKNRLQEIDNTYPSGLTAEQRVDFVLQKRAK
ncbi:MAG: alpha-L-glutamate ligase-like protein [Alphaproteobacteria bacterium]|nr:alpha-L-glutamate ligase-like protein [Alphaproteobacteria bacterium]MBQ7286053.1 alpha-L-glutamate ligase-like protein [Alphaproteobacteria bacterium]